MTTNEYIRNVKDQHWKPFDKKVWQRNYYEHIIRNEKALAKIREYIIYNRMQWERDRETFKKMVKFLTIDVSRKPLYL